MKNLAFLFFIFTSFTLRAQISGDQITADEIKKGLTGKEWKIIKYELFGVDSAPLPEQVNDIISLKNDMTFVVVENGKEYKGKWTILNPVVYINCKESSGLWSKTYKVISIGEKESIIEYKDPDLIKTKYHLEVK